MHFEADGSYYDFCRPKMVGKAVEKKKWGDEQKDLLIQVREDWHIMKCSEFRLKRLRALSRVFKSTAAATGSRL